MVDHRSDFVIESDSGQQPKFRQQDDDRRLLELQLIQLRKEAHAARLEARAAEIEIMLRHMALAEAVVAEGLDDRSLDLQVADSGTAKSKATVAIAAPTGNRREASAASPKSAKGSTVAGRSSEASRLNRKAKQPPSDSAECAVVAGEMKDLSASLKSSPRQAPSTQGSRIGSKRAGVSNDPAPPLLSARSLDSSQESTKPRRRARPKAVLFSAVIHGGLLVLLAAVSLHSPRPKDQISITAISAETAEEPIATVKLETSEPDVVQTEPTEVKAEVQFEPLADLTQVELAAGPGMEPPLDALTSSSAQSVRSEALSLSASPAEKITFCGVEGGGNHFVYLVDCSKSMGTAFDSARAELLHSIETLKSDQRFYVIFFDASPDYMRVSQRDVDDPRSVLATRENKESLRRWAASIQMDSGAAPYQPLEFALELRPDVIFLLSDGEFPAGIEQLLLTKNRVDNLFGDDDVRTIVHTIGYHSREGENRMRAIAAQNRGQYRYVPKPVR